MTRNHHRSPPDRSWGEPAWQAAATHTYCLAHEALLQLPAAGIARGWLDTQGIGPRAWLAYQLGYAEVVPRPDGESILAPAITIPWIVGGRVRAIRYLLLESQGEHSQVLLPGSAVAGVLYGGHALDNGDPTKKTLLVIEGELNALSVFLAAGATNLDVLAVDAQTRSLPAGFYTHAARYRQVIYWLSQPELLQEASHKFTSGYQVQGAGKPAALELQRIHRLGEVLARIRCKVAQNVEQKQQLLCDLMQAASNTPLGIDSGTFKVVRELAAVVLYRETLAEVMNGRFVCSAVPADLPPVKTLFPVKPEKIPHELTQLPQWIGYQLAPKPNGKTDKIPKNPHTGGNASVTAPPTWSDFLTALDFANRSEEADGVAIVLSGQDNLVVVDIDDCVLPDGNLKPAAQKIVAELNSYSEISPSGRGVHLFAFGKLPPGRRRSQKLGIEMYETERFMTVTGHHLPGTPTQVLKRTEQLQQLHVRIFGNQTHESCPAAPSEMPASDWQLWLSVFEASGGGRVRQLFEGDISGSSNDPSQAVIDLGNALAYWTNNDKQRMKRMFYQTALKRDKWEERRGEITWLDYQINDCIAYISRRK